MKKLLLILLLFAGSICGQSIDSTIVPVMESYDTTCQCYTDQFVIYVVDYPDALNDSLVVEFGFREAGKDIWFATITFTDSLGGFVATRAAFIKQLDPYDVSRDGEVSIHDLGMLIRRLFF